ncbi:hypothetical protein, partial [Pseudomonas sp. FSL R10-0071]|uniref:hypothetical protein n=1 Tax=Pseudomonas sp. FSL R10-0071 TaxID=2662193 RepID=UPI001C498CA0
GRVVPGKANQSGSLTSNIKAACVAAFVCFIPLPVLGAVSKIHVLTLYAYLFGRSLARLDNDYGHGTDF